MNHNNLSTAQPLFCPFTVPMVDGSAIRFFENDLPEPLILGRLARNTVVNIPSTPAQEQ